MKSLSGRINEFCLKLEKNAEKLTQTAELATAEEYDELRRGLAKSRPDLELRMMPPPVVIRGSVDSPKTNANNVDLLAFAYTLRNLGANILNAIETNPDGGGCNRLGDGGDCSNYIGLPGKSIPGQHDGPDDTVDAYGKPNGWCWSCWKSLHIQQLETLVSALRSLKKKQSEFHKALVVAVDDLDSCVSQQQVKEADIIVTLDGKILKNRYGHRSPPRECPPLRRHVEIEIANALKALSGNLSHDNVAKAKAILGELL